MDLSRFPLSGWPLSGMAAALPDGLVAALVSALATLALVAVFGPRRGPARSRAAAEPPADAPAAVAGELSAAHPAPPRAVGLRGLIAMGFAGGLVPSPSALVVLLGAVVSSGGALSESEKSSIVTLPAALMPIPTDSAVAPAGTAGVRHDAWFHVNEFGSTGERPQKIHWPAALR